MNQARPRRRERRAGFTLIEVMVALGLFGLIAVAGFTLLDGIVGVRDRMDGRLYRLAELQRAMYLITLDFEAISEGPIEQTGSSVTFRRRSPTALGGSTTVRYAVVAESLHRQLGEEGDQRLISGVSSAEWTFHLRGAGWGPQPSAPVVADLLQAPETRPDAVAVTLELAGSDGGLKGRLRRVVELPARP